MVFQSLNFFKRIDLVCNISNYSFHNVTNLILNEMSIGRCGIIYIVEIKLSIETLLHDHQKIFKNLSSNKICIYYQIFFNSATAVFESQGKFEK